VDLEPRAVTEPSIDGTGRRIVVNTAYRSVADIGAKLLSLALYAVMARRLGPAGFGIYTFALSLVPILVTLGDFGQDKVLIREVARDRGRLDELFVNTLTLRVSLILPVILVAGAVGPLVGLDGDTRLVVLLLGLAWVLERVTSTCFAVFQAFERLGFVPIVLILQRGFAAAVGIGVLVAGGSVVAVAAVYLVSAALAAGVAVILLRRRVAQPRMRVDVSRWGPLMRAAAPIGIASTFSTLLFRSDAVILGVLTTSAVVGEYGAAFRLFETTLFLSWSVAAGVFPVFSRLTTSTDPPLSWAFERGLKLATALTLPLAVGAAVLAPGVIEVVYGPGFERSPEALILLAPAIALHPIGYVCGHLLISQDRQHVLTWTFGAVAAVNIAANVLLIPRFSLFAAAVTTSSSEVLLTGVLLLFARRQTGEIRWVRTMAGPCVAAVVAGVVMALLRASFPVAVAAGALSYAGVLLAVEFAAFPDDARALIGLSRRAT
jgi:O-antigen/teichoic acid export membrane protein